MDLKEANKVQGRHPWEIARWRIVVGMMKKYVVGGRKTILDIGCGDAFCLAELHKAFPRNSYYGVDTHFTSEFMEKQKAANDALHLTDDLERVQTEKVDVVLLMDVLEHIPDDGAFLRALLSLPYVKDQTVFFVTVPAFQWLFVSRDAFLEHYRRYEYKSLRNLLHTSGYKVQQQGYFFFSLLLVRCVEAITEKRLGTGKRKLKGIGQWKAGLLETNMLVNLLLLDYFVTSLLSRVKVLIPGLSIYCICSKRA